MKRILAIDYGRARIGVAVSDELLMLAHPLETIVVKVGKDPIKRIAEIVQKYEVDRVVVGVPRNMNGSFGQSAIEAQRFCEKLRTVVACPVTDWDERLTTVAAQRALQESGRTEKNSRDVVDQVAAQMVLQGYLDRLQAEETRSPSD